MVVAPCSLKSGVPALGVGHLCCTFRLFDIVSALARHRVPQRGWGEEGGRWWFKASREETYRRARVCLMTLCVGALPSTPRDVIKSLSLSSSCLQILLPQRGCAACVLSTLCSSRRFPRSASRLPHRDPARACNSSFMAGCTEEICRLSPVVGDGE